jgi:hypothetical protein
MTVHLSRPAVGIDSLEHFHEVIEARAERGDPDTTWITTRNAPKRADELCDGGSVYWIIKRHFVARQKVLRVEKLDDDNGRSYCMIYLAADLVHTVPQPRRAHQGWRYLNVADAPADLPRGSGGDLSPEMAAELKDLGLL